MLRTLLASWSGWVIPYRRSVRLSEPFGIFLTFFAALPVLRVPPALRAGALDAGAGAAVAGAGADVAAGDASGAGELIVAGAGDAGAGMLDGGALCASALAGTNPSAAAARMDARVFVFIVRL